MDELDYNVCNSTFRSLTNQQELMVAEVARHIGAEGQASFTSYGCGFGMFELELIAALDNTSVRMHGVDTNRAAISRLDRALKDDPKVGGHELRVASMADIATIEMGHTEVGMFVHSLYYLDADDAMAVLKEARNRHDKVIVAVTPHNRLNEAFARALAEQNVRRPLFADTFSAELAKFAVPFTEVTVPAEIIIPQRVPTTTLAEFLTFATHQFFDPATGREHLLERAAALGTDDGDRITISHPVGVYVIN